MMACGYLQRWQEILFMGEQAGLRKGPHMALAVHGFCIEVRRMQQGAAGATRPAATPTAAQHKLHRCDLLVVCDRV